MDDIRNKFDVDAPRCKGGYLDQAPSCIWTEGDWVLEPKMDGIRVTLQIGAERSLLIGRNRQDFMKGVDHAGEFRNLSSTNREIASIACPELGGTVLDGELTETCLSDGSYDEWTKVRKEEGIFTGFTAWTVLVFKGDDVRGMSDATRRDMAGFVVAKLNHPKVILIERVPATRENLKMFFDRGEEGAIAKKATAPIKPGQRTNPWWWKIKGDENRTVDAFVIGAEKSCSGGSGVKGLKRKPNGKAATFTMAMMNDEHEAVEIGKVRNLPHDATQFGLKEFERFKDRVIEMRVSGFDGRRFRWPRFVRWREDKMPDDCRLSEQIGR